MCSKFVSHSNLNIQQYFLFFISRINGEGGGVQSYSQFEGEFEQIRHPPILIVTNFRGVLSLLNTLPLLVCNL